MELTAKSLGELIKSLRSSKPGTSQKRAEARVGLRIKVEIQLLDPHTGFGAERLAAWVRDVSAGGVGLLCNRGLKDGEAFDLLVKAPGGEEKIPCVISYCRSVGTDLYRIGAQFQGFEPKDDDD